MADWLKGKGRLESEFRKADNLSTPLEAFLKDAGNGLRDIIRQKIYEPQPRFFSPQSGLTEANAQGSQTMMAGLDSIPSADAGGGTIEFTSQSEHTLWRNDGISGWERKLDTPYSYKKKHPSIAMAESIDEWMRAAGVDPEQVSAWAIATAILRRGIDGHRFIENTFTDDNLNSFETALINLMENNIDGRLERVAPNFK